MKILWRLLALVAVALLPAIAIQAYNEFDLRGARQVEVQTQALSLAKLAAEEQQQIIQGIRQVLIVLSELPAIRSKDSSACNESLAGLKSRFPGFLTFVVTDVNGQPFCDSNGNRKPVSVAKRPYFAEVLKSRAFTVGEFSIGLSVPRKVIQFALPFDGDDGQISGVIIAALGLDWLADNIAQKGVPAGDAVAITDRNSTYLARYPDNGRFVGQKPFAGGEEPKRRQGTAADLFDVDGVERIVGFSSLGPASGGLLVSVGINKTKAFAQIQHRTHRGILLISLSAMTVLILTLLGAQRFIHRPLGLLVGAANQWRLGDYARRLNIRDKSEIAWVADAFNTMADALERRERELSDAKEKAEDAAARITMVFESTTDSVVITDRHWRISFLNQRARTAFGEGRELIGMDLQEALPDAFDTKMIDWFRAAMSNRRPVSFEIQLPRRGVWYAINAFPSGEGLAIFLRDITAHKNAVEARQLIEEQLHQSQKMEAVGQLTGGIAHDFNNLLAVISANLQLVERAAKDGEVLRFVTSARRATDRGARLTAQLLAFSRQQVLKPKLVNASELISGFYGLIRQAVGQGCEVQLHTDERLWFCQVDPALLETAVLNLALNGRDAMPDGGVLEIATRNVVLDEGAVGGCPPGSYVTLSVTDTGHGMSPEVRDRIFEPFFTTKEVGKGTGLGLSMVYGFVRQSNGHVTVESTPHSGTTIALFLPKATQESLPEEEADQTPAMPGGSERILLVEDDEDLLEAMSATLSDFGYRVVCARNGTEALRILDSGQEFDLLFSDIAMPNGPNGIELAGEARRRSKEIKILLTSGYAKDVLARHTALGEFPIMQKPFQISDLAKRVRSVLQGAGDDR
jgi:signal transduction histidine kinase/ActR/RegA family two-component response regulator/HAMP domain-containing protein